MRVFFMGTPDFAARSLSELYGMENVEVVGVFTQPDKPVGRKQRLEAPPVKLIAERHNTPVYQPVKMRDGTAAKIVADTNPDLVVVVAYGRILPDDILNIPPLGSINIHGSILPKYRGAAPIQWAVINGERETGVTAMYMTSELDAGDIIDIRTTEIGENETSGELFERLSDLGAELLRDTVISIENGTAGRTPQDSSLATFAPPLTKELSEIDFSRTGREIISHILGMNPWPVATAEISGTKFKIFRAILGSKQGQNMVKTPPGTVLFGGKNGLEIACGDGSVIITELQAPGGKRMSAADYLRGHPICP